MAAKKTEREATAAERRRNTPTNTQVYDVARRDSLEALESKWLPDFEAYSNVEGAIQMVGGECVLAFGVRV